MMVAKQSRNFPARLLMLAAFACFPTTLIATHPTPAEPADRLPLLAQAASKPDAGKPDAGKPDSKSDDKADAKSDAKSSGKSKVSVVESKGLEIVEAELLQFVENEQPRLLKLLEFMKRKQPTQYSQALRELSKTKHRLGNLEKRDPDLHKIELQLWQVRSQLRMLVAEIAVSKGDAKAKLRDKLSALVAEEVDLDAARLALEQTRAQQRLKQLETQLDELTADRDATIAKSLKAWENRVQRQSPRKNTSPE